MIPGCLYLPAMSYPVPGLVISLGHDSSLSPASSHRVRIQVGRAWTWNYIEPRMGNRRQLPSGVQSLHPGSRNDVKVTCMSELRRRE